MFALGGLLTLLLTLSVRFGGTFAPVRAQTATCFRELARYLEAARGERLGPPETCVRAAILEARRLAAQARQATVGTSRVNQRALMLIDIADRLFSIIGAARETGQPQIPGCKTAQLAVAGALNGRARPAELRRLRSALEERAAAAEREPASAFGPAVFERRIVQELGHALSIAGDDELPIVAFAPATPRTCLAAALSLLLANLDRNSVVARHALRFALVTKAPPLAGSRGVAL
jgi:hypothetical protein